MDTTNRNTALASALVEELARCGVRHAVISPGSRSAPVALALHRDPAIEDAVVLDERSAGFVALGAAQATGLPVAVACTSGSAAANLHPAIVEADEAGVPLLALTSDRPPELRGIGAGQTIDQLKLYGSAVRWFCEVGTHDADDAGLLHMRSTACHAVAAASGELRPGPVHLNLSWRDPLAPEPRPEDVTAQTPLALEGRGEAPLTDVARSPRMPGEALLDDLADRIASTPQGIILAGRQADPALAVPVAALARSAGYPILAEPTSQLRFGPHDRSLVVSPYDAIVRAGPAALEPELVVRFGEMPTSKPLRRWLERCRPTEIAIDPPGAWNDPIHGVATIVPAAAGAVAAALAERIAERDESEWTEAWLAAERSAAATIAAELERLDEPTEPSAHAALGGLYGDGELVYTASSMPIRDQEAFLGGGSVEVRFLCNRGANGIDGLLSSGIGAAWATGRPTWIVTGDLGLVHDIGGLASHGLASAPVRIVVLDNGGGGIFEFLPHAELVEREEFEALFGTPSGIDPARVAALFDLPHRRIDQVAELKGLADAGACLIEIPVDRRANVALHERIANAVAAALRAA